MKILKKIAAVLALFIGVMSVFAGTRVLLGIDTKDYPILTWLVSYNVIFGLISLITSYYIWKNSSKGKNLTLFILIMHFMVFLYLKFFSDTVAIDSIKAMVFRTSIWLLITILSIIIPKYFNRQQQ